MHSRYLPLSAAILTLVTVGACQGLRAEVGQDQGHQHAAAFADVASLIAVMRPTDGNQVGGTVTFTPVDDGVQVVADITGLSANGTHAIHVHQYGDARAADGTSAGGHYNPGGHDHGLPEQEHRHAGDFGNLQSDADGTAQMTLTVDNISLTGAHAVIGRSVIIHAKKDDGGQPTGNAGPRIGIGVIGVAKP